MSIIFLGKKKIEMINDNLSYKINTLSLISIILVLYIHSHNLFIVDLGMIRESSLIKELNVFFQNFVSGALSRVAIPIFFVISGFFLFKKFSYKSYFEILKKRFFTLFIPYLFWSALVVLIFYTLQSFAFSKVFFTRILISDLNYYELFRMIFLEPKNYPLWFLRDLIMLVVFSPVIFYLLKKYKYIYLIILVILWLFFYPKVNTSFSMYKPDVLLFFSIGAYLALFKEEALNFQISNTQLFFLFLSYLTLLLWITALVLQEGILFLIPILLLKLSIIIGILTLWFFLDYIKLTKIYFITNFTFIIYVFHEPLLTIYKKIFFSIFGNNSLVSLLAYIFVPVLTILTVTLFGYILKKYFFKISKVILGNRI